jgi:hypothetical protein
LILRTVDALHINLIATATGTPSRKHSDTAVDCDRIVPRHVTHANDDTPHRVCRWLGVGYGKPEQKCPTHLFLFRGMA